MAEEPPAIAGIGVGRGAAIGPVVRAHPPVAITAACGATDPHAAAHDVEAALALVADEFETRSRAAAGDLAAVLQATASMGRDPSLVQAAVERAKAGTAPAVAVDEAVEDFCATFAAAGGYLAERVTDLRSIRDRVVARLLGVPYPGIPLLDRPSIVVARDLAPADLVGLDAAAVFGIVVEEGGPTSHTAIVARQLGVPCVVRARGADALHDEQVVAIDAATGIVTPDPDQDLIDRVAARGAALAALASDRSAGATADGHRVQLLANIGGPADTEHPDVEGAEGIGLFRTEILYLDAPAAPPRHAQAAAYGRVLTALGGRKVVIRTLDAGADKPLAFVAPAAEENPALGVRGYRLARSDGQLLVTQLEAIADAAKATGTAPWVMAPMVSTASEAAAFAALARQLGVEHVGVMIEVPGAALRAAEILAEVDFASLGTNDLAQYTMAADRLRGELADLLDPWQPAVLDLVAATAAAGTEAAKPIGVCGESASDPLMALALVGMGVTSLSMAASAIPAVRFCLSRHTLAECLAIAEAARRARSAAEARAAALALIDSTVRATLGLA